MLSALIRFSVERRYLVLTLTLLLASLGLWSFRQLTITAMPDVGLVQVQINSAAPGYSPLEVEQRITQPVERALFGLPDLAYTRSISRYGLSQVTVIFKEGTDIYFARNLIDSRLSIINERLPAEVTPRMGPISTGLGEVLLYALEAAPDAKKANGEPVTPMDLREVQEWIIKPQLVQVSGVSEINTIGGHEKRYQIMPQPKAMLELGVSLSDIIDALKNNNSNVGAGYITRNGEQLLVRSVGRLESIQNIKQVVVRLHDGAPVQIGDVATVAIGKPLRTGAATRNGKETVLGTVLMRTGENSRSVASQARAKLDMIRSSLPNWVELKVVYDRSHLVNQAIHTVEKNLLEGALLVIVILFLLLGNFRAALITAAVIPLSMLITFTGMVKQGIPANLMSLGALDFGLIVDGAVIIVENCIRRLAQTQKANGGELPFAARLSEVREATLEVIKPSLFGVAIITLVYIPLFALDGVAGKMFYPMAATVVIALLAAMLLSMTLIPAAIAIFMKGPVSEHESKGVAVFKQLYEPMLHHAMRWRVWLTSGAALLILGSLWLGSNLGAVFIPQLNEGDLAVQVLRVNGTSLNQSLAMQQQVEKRLLQFPEVETAFAKTGTSDVATDAMPPNVSDTFVMLKPRTAWPNPDKPKEALVAEMESALDQLPGNKYEFTQPVELRFNELVSGIPADVGVKLFGDDLDTLKTYADQIAGIAQSIEGAADTRVEAVSNLPILSITPKPINLARYGLTVAGFQSIVSAAIGGYQAGTIYEGERYFELMVRLSDEKRSNIRLLSSLPISTPGGNYVPLGEIASIAIQQAPAQVSRENGKRRIVVTTNVRDRDVGSFVVELKQQLAQQLDLPSGYWLEYAGSFKQLESAGWRLAVITPLVLLAIFGLLMVAFRSFKDSLIIFMGIPFALTGGVLALWLRDMPFSITSGVGFIALSGVAVLNGLVMLTFIRQLWQGSGELLSAVIEGALTRLRPVLMTALVASLGFIPMALNTSIGAEVQRPLATVVIGGIISSTLLTLVLLPVFYHWLHQKDQGPPL